MPYVNGVEFIETLRKNGCKCPHMALVSGSFPEPDNLDRVARLGVKFFAKPIHRDRIIEWLNQIEPAPLSEASNQGPLCGGSDALP
jgi:CheY-like chemotaxis protein